MENTTAPVQFRIHRSRTNRMVGGVCGGLAESFAVDVNLIRIALVVLTIVGVGAGIVLYLVMWALAPEEDAAPSTPTATPAGPFAA